VVLVSLATAARASTVWKLTFDNQALGNAPGPYTAGTGEIVPIALTRQDHAAPNAIAQVVTSTGPQGGRSLAVTAMNTWTWADQQGYYVNDATAGNIGGDGSFTIEAVVKISSYTPNAIKILELAGNFGLAVTGQLYTDFDIRTNGGINGLVGGPGSIGQKNATAPTGTVPLNTWVHLACVYTPDPDPGNSAHTARIIVYKDGVQVAMTTFEGATATPLPLNRWGFGMMANVNYNNRSFNGEIDGLAVSNTALNPTQFVLQSFSVASQFPQLQATKVHGLGGNVRGFGMLAQYASPGPSAVYVARTTTVPGSEPYKPIALARVFDPDGNLVGVYDFTDQATGTTTAILPINATTTVGTWRVSLSGGRINDRLEIGLPTTATWGVRGEMSLGISETLPSDMYVYLPRTVTKIYCESFGGQTPDVEFYDQDNTSLGKPTYNASTGRNLLTVSTLTPSTVYRLRQGVTDNAGFAVAFDGVPGLLCPTVAAANALQGGTLETDSLLVAGPLQKRIRTWMYNQRSQSFDPALVFPASVPANLPNPQLECLTYAKYEALSTLDSALLNQVTDYTNPYYGAHKPATDTRASWESFLHGGVLSPFDASGLSGVITTPGTMNPAYNGGAGNAALQRRATLSAFYHFVSMQGDDLLRENDFSVNSYPMSNMFFVYENLAKSYLLLKDRLDPEAKALWQAALIEVGDKYADHQAYESNQFMHVITGHLETYLATGEPRFKKYFERELTAMLDGTFGANNKFGQHPAGYFLEEYGPDGNYDHLSAYCLATMYDRYCSLPEADQTLVSKIITGINKQLTFQSYFWMKQPNGDFYCPTGIDCRTTAMLGIPGYPGVWMLHHDFNLAKTRFMLNDMPATGNGSAATYSHLANTDTWAMRVLNTYVPLQDSAWTNIYNVQGTWTSDIYRCYTRPDTSTTVTIPSQATSGTWTLSGLLAWKRSGGLYGLNMYDVVGAINPAPSGKFGGAPTALWSAGTGLAVSSMKNNNSGGAVTVPADLTHSCVYGHDVAGTFFWTGAGTQRSTFAWITQNYIAEITTNLTSPAGWQVKWRYQFEDTETIITVTLTTTSSPQDAYINLPIYLPDSVPVITGPSNGLLTYTRGTAHMDISWPTNVIATLDAPVAVSAGNVRRLSIPLPTDGTPLTFHVRAY
jgi:hypothetical protein